MRFISIIFLFLASSSVFAQEIANFTQFFVNPYTVNPSFAGIEGRTGLYLTYRQQWVDFDGGPTVANASFHSALTKNLNLGLNFNNDTRGVLSTSSALLSFAYAARLAKDVYLRFGASGGLAFNGLDLDQISNPSDPAFANALSNNNFLVGNAGLSLHIKSFHVGASMPDLFEPQLISADAFSLGDIRPSERLIFSASNRFYFGNDKYVFEPYVLYRIHKNLPTQLEAAGIMHLNHTVWFGGTYKQDFGISATAGFKIPESFGIGYSYTFKNLGLNEIQSATHEVTFSLLLGKKKPKHQKYSFVNTLIDPEPDPIPAAPTGDTEQTFCEIDRPTIDQLRATGTDIKWYSAEKDGNPLTAATVLLNNSSYYASQTVKNIESTERLKVDVKVIKVGAPQAEQLQTFDSGDEPRISDLVATSDKVIWYAGESGGTALSTERTLRDGTTYYASQVSEGCESIERFPVMVKITTTEVPKDTIVTTPVKDPVQDANLNDKETSDETVVVKRGQHLLELPLGVYVIVGVFSEYSNADKFSDNLFMKGYHDTKFGYLTEKKLWYVFIRKNNDPVGSRVYRDEVRKSAFRDAWVLEVRE